VRWTRPGGAFNSRSGVGAPQHNGEVRASNIARVGPFRRCRCWGVGSLPPAPAYACAAEGCHGRHGTRRAGAEASSGLTCPVRHGTGDATVPVRKRGQGAQLKRDQPTSTVLFEPFPGGMSVPAPSLFAMTSAMPKRPVSELPGDPARLHFHYGHGHPAVPYDSEDTLESWYVTVTYGMASDEEWEDEEDGGDGAPAAGSEIGHLILWRLRDYTGDNRWEVVDAESGDLEVIVSAVLGRSQRTGYSAAFEKAVTHPVGDLLILDRVSLDREWRGFGLGPALAGEAVRRLSGGCCAVAVFPAMGEYPEGREQVTEAYRRQAKKKIAALWESIGFQPFRRGVWLLDTALRQPEELMQARRAELRALGTVFQRRPSA
jgi:GNAT superfamily N-acetyltransferase